MIRLLWACRKLTFRWTERDIPRTLPTFYLCSSHYDICSYYDIWSYIIMTYVLLIRLIFCLSTAYTLASALHVLQDWDFSMGWPTEHFLYFSINIFNLAALTGLSVRGISAWLCSFARSILSDPAAICWSPWLFLMQAYVSHLEKSSSFLKTKTACLTEFGNVIHRAV